MGRVLAISSQVARGHVGLSAIVPALQRFGHDVVALPTVILSNHLGHRLSAGEHVSPDLLRRMLAALDGNGWLAEIDAVLTGYLPSTEHVCFAAETVTRLRKARPESTFLCDPVLGDDPRGLYVDTGSAAAVRESLIPLASVATPNRFELAWLSGRRVASPADAIVAARAMPAPLVIATGIAGACGTISTVCVTSGRSSASEVPRLEGVPHGTGDLFSALYLAHLLDGHDAHACLGSAVAGVQAAIQASVGLEELALVTAVDAWTKAAPLPVLDLA